MHCGAKFQPYFQEQSSILSQIYLRDIFCLSWRDLILWKASPQWCAANMVLWSHSWNREKIHFWTLSKMNVWEKHTWSSKWLFQVPFYTRYMILHACGTAWHFRYPTAIKSTLPVSPVCSVTLADFSGQEGHRLCTGWLGAVSSQSRGPQLDNLE